MAPSSTNLQVSRISVMLSPGKSRKTSILQSYLTIPSSSYIKICFCAYHRVRCSALASQHMLAVRCFSYRSRVHRTARRRNRGSSRTRPLKQTWATFRRLPAHPGNRFPQNHEILMGPQRFSAMGSYPPSPMPILWRPSTVGAQDGHRPFVYLQVSL